MIFVVNNQIALHVLIYIAKQSFEKIYCENIISVKLHIANTLF